MRRQDDGGGCGARGFRFTQAGLPGGDGAPLAGTRTCRQELADRRGWSTFSKAWPVRRSDTAVARREAPVRPESDARLRLPSVAPHRRATPSALSGVEGECRLTRGRSNNTGDHPCPPAEARSAKAGLFEI